jgi:hypothetical protein
MDYSDTKIYGMSAQPYQTIFPTQQIKLPNNLPRFQPPTHVLNLQKILPSNPLIKLDNPILPSRQQFLV